MKQFKRYPKYKDTGIEWLGEIPEGWELKKTKFLSNIFNGDSLNDSQKAKFSADQLIGTPYISTKDINVDNAEVCYRNGLTIPVNIKGFKIAPNNGTLLCIEGGSAGKKIAVLNQNVCFVNKLACFIPKSGFDSKFQFYSLQGTLFQTQFSLGMTGLIGGVALSLIKEFIMLAPTLTQQIAIAAFLDEKTAKIDKAIAQKEKMIELLKERKQIIIQNAVTKGIDPKAKMKDSGIEWIGEIPEGWEVKRLKYILDERNERSKDGSEPLFMMSQIYGLVIRSDFHEKAEVASTTIGNKRVHKNDLVFNKLKAHLGVFFKSTIEEVGIVSPDYAVYKSKGIFSDLKYLEILFRHPAYISIFICKATGIVEGLIRLYTHDLLSIKVPVPPKRIQLDILEFIETQSSKIDKAIAIQEQQIAKLKEYKSILIDNAVTGKIKVC